MPQQNLPLGLFGIFISALDPSIVQNPPEDPPPLPTNPSQGVWSIAVAAGVVVNITKFLQQYAMSPNASLGGQFGANMLTGIDIVFAGPTGLTINAQLMETTYLNGATPRVRTAGTDISMDFQVKSQPVLPTPANGSSIIGWILGYPPGTGYWLIGQNNNDTETHLEISFSTAVTLFGINLYFGQR